MVKQRNFSKKEFKNNNANLKEGLSYMIKSLSSESLLTYIKEEKEKRLSNAQQQLKKAQSEATQIRNQAQLKVTQILSQIIDSIYIINNKGIKILDGSANEIRHFNIPAPFCLTLDVIQNRLYFIQEKVGKQNTHNKNACFPFCHPNHSDEEKIEAFLYSVDLNTMEIIELWHTQYKSSIARLSAGALAIHVEQEKLVWLLPTGTIATLDMHGQNYQELAKISVANLAPLYNLIISPKNGYIYWATGKQQQDDEWDFDIWRMENNGSNARIIVPSILSRLDKTLPSVQLAVDENDGKIYWNNKKQIECANLDGTNRQTLYTLSNHALGIHIDPIIKKIFWIEDNKDLIWANLDGSNIAEKAMDINLPDDSIYNLIIRTNADEAVEKLQEVRLQRELVMNKANQDIALAHQQAESELSPIREDYNRAKAQYDTKFEPEKQNLENQLQQAKIEHDTKVKNAEVKIETAQKEANEKKKIAQKDYNEKVEKAQQEANEEIDKANEDLNEARKKR
ncbi:hypothetical protein U4C99_004162 [Bacillus cereus]|nr:hypothetical protein [Bacillus cereus]